MGKLLLSTFLLLALGPSLAQAYGESEQELMREDVREALNRARDFNAQKMREATESREREKGVKEVKKDRAEFETKQEETREEYVKDRNSRPSEFLLQARSERSFDEQKLIEDREMERNRQRYARDHRKVQRIIDHKAHIDEATEYGL